MSVDEWARREAERSIEGIEEVVRGAWVDVEDVELKRDLFADGIVHAFDALLSDEAVEAAAELFYLVQTGDAGKYRTSMYKEAWDTSARAALQAAVGAVTEGESE